jgi:hypothetical protein
MGHQQEEPLRRHNKLHEVAEVVRSRAPVKKTLNIILTRIPKLCESVEFGPAELERCEDRPQKGQSPSEQLPHLLDRSRPVNSIGVEFVEETLVVAKGTAEWWYTRPFFQKTSEATRILALVVLLEFLQLADSG